MKKLFPSILILLSALLLFGCHKAESLRVNLNYQATYKTTGDSDVSEFKADFYSLSDKSLYFVKVNDGNKTYTLTRTISASGERYIDETQKIEFWTKGETAFIEELDSDGNGTGKTINLTEVKAE